MLDMLPRCSEVDGLLESLNTVGTYILHARTLGGGEGEGGDMGVAEISEHE